MKLPRFASTWFVLSCFCMTSSLSAEELTGASPTLPSAPAASIADTSERLDAGLQKSIYLDLRDINVVDILKFLALQGDLNIVTSKNVQGRSTLVLRNVKIKDALDIIVISNQLAYEVKNDIIYIMPEEEYVTVYGKNYNDKRSINTRTIKYAKPAYVLTALEALQSTIGKVLVDEDTGTVIMIDTAEKLVQMNVVLNDMERRLDTEVITLQNAKAKDIEAQLKLRLDAKAVGTVASDERSNQLIISAYPDRMEEVLEIVKSLDTPDRAVLLEVRILQLTLKPSFDYGIDWQKTFTGKGTPGSLQALDFHGSFPIEPTTTTALDTFGRFAVGNATADDYTVQINLLREVSDTKILANPRIMVLDNQEAKINIGDRVPYVITTTTGTGNNVSVSEEIKFIDIGLLLNVTPKINDDGFITMKIDPEISSRIGTLTTPTNNQIPIVNTTKLNSSIVVQDGKTVILGGLRRDDLTLQNRGVPGLMDIPVVGALFQNRNETYTKTEIVIFITPKVVRGEKSVLDEPMAIKGDLDPRKPVVVQTGVGKSLPLNIKTDASGRMAGSLGAGLSVQTESSDAGLTAVSATPRVSL